MNTVNGSGNPPIHDPVLVDRVVELLAPALDRPDGAGERVVVDATLGLGGHAEALLRRCPEVRLVGLDRDAAALARARERLTAYTNRLDGVHAIYDELPDVLDRLGVDAVHGVLFDLGVSSLQLDDPERGFTYSRDVPLDMRMDRSAGQTAAEVLNGYPERELVRIFRTYGEERFAGRIAAAIVRARAAEPFSGTARLAELVRDAVPAAARERSGHPAKRIFQALRIEVNDELDALRRALPAAIDALAVDGRIAVLAYHSLEDRLVKRTFADLARPSVPDGVPDIPAGHEPVLRLLTRGAERPSDEETTTNPRAASARLRAAERIRRTDRGRP